MTLFVPGDLIRVLHFGLPAAACNACKLPPLAPSHNIPASSIEQLRSVFAEIWSRQLLTWPSENRKKWYREVVLESKGDFHAQCLRGCCFGDEASNMHVRLG